jgi:hypothetical protein
VERADPPGPFNRFRRSQAGHPLNRNAKRKVEQRPVYSASSSVDSISSLQTALLAILACMAAGYLANLKSCTAVQKTRQKQATMLS